MKSENKNFLMNVGYQGLTLVFPLITVPWISRALGVDNIGIYSYTYSIASIFMLVGMLGVSNYGNRSIARIRDDNDALSREFISIYILQLAVNIAAVLSYIVYLLILKPEYCLISWIQLISVASICFDVSWLFFGLEKFKATITRNLIVKVLSLVLIVVLVRTPDDLLLYAMIMAVSTFISQFYLFILARRYIHFVRPDFHNMRRRVKDALILFLPVAAYSVYHILDKTMLGSMASVTELGYFENAEKLVNIPIAVITALGTVMLPRMSYMFSDPNADYRGTLQNSMNLVLMISCAMAVGLFMISDDVSPIVFGDGFDGCGPVIRYMSLAVIFTAWSNVIRTQLLIPKARDRVYVGSTVGAALLNLAINVALIPQLGALGACVGTLLAELFIAVYQTLATKDDLDIGIYLRFFAIHFGKSMVMAIAALFAASFVDDLLWKLLTEVLVFTGVFFLLNWRYLLFEFMGVKK